MITEPYIAKIRRSVVTVNALEKALVFLGFLVVVAGSGILSRRGGTICGGAGGFCGPSLRVRC